MNCAECFAEYLQHKFGVCRIVPCTSVVMSNFLCSVIVIHEAHHGLCNQRDHRETGCPCAVQAGLGTSCAPAVQGYSCFLCTIKLQRAVSDKRLR